MFTIPGIDVLVSEWDQILHIVFMYKTLQNILSNDIDTKLKLKCLEGTGSINQNYKFLYPMCRGFGIRMRSTLLQCLLTWSFEGLL